MKIPETAIIPETKLTGYLLVFKARNDKSQYLSQAGFTLDNWQSLKKGIQEIIKKNEAIEDRKDQYGTYYRVKGNLGGINNLKLTVVTIRLKRKVDNQFQFITLKPDKK